MSQQTDKIKTLSNANEEETEIDLLELFYYLKAKLVWLISFFVIGAVIAGLITYFLITPKYTATSKLYMVSASSDSIVNLSDLNLGTSLTDDYVELLKIRLPATPAAEHTRLVNGRIATGWIHIIINTKSPTLPQIN